MTQDSPPNARNHSGGSISPSSPDGEGSSTRLNGHSWVVRALMKLASLVLMMLIAVGGFFAVLSRGPMELPFLTERIASALENQLGTGIDVQVGRTLLESTDGGILLHVQDVTILNAQQKTVLRSPNAFLSFDPLRLLAFSFVPRRFELRGMVIRAIVTKDGEVVLSAAEAGEPALSGQPSNIPAPVPLPALEIDQQTRLSQALEMLAVLAQRGTAGELSAIKIENATLHIDDQRLGTQVSFEKLKLAFDSPEKGIARASGAVSKGDTVIPFSIDVKDTAPTISFDVQVANIDETILSVMIGIPELPFSPRGTISVRATVTTDSVGKPLTANSTLQLANGFVEMKGLGQNPFRVTRADLSVHWSGGTGKLDTVSLNVKGDEYSAAISGPVSLPTATDPWFRLDGKGADWKVSGLAAKDPSITVDTVTMKLAVRNDGRKVLLDALTLKGPQTDLSITGEVFKSPEGPVLKAQAIAGAMPARNALRWWPTFLAPVTRGFFIKSVQSGELKKMDLALDLPAWALTGLQTNRPLPPEALSIQATIEDVTAIVDPNLPPLAGLSGSGGMDSKQAQGVTTAAHIDLRNGKKIPLQNGIFSLTGLDGELPKGVFKFKTQTSMENIAELLKNPQLKSVVGIALDPASIKGQFDGQGNVTIPLVAGLQLKDVVTVVQARMTGVTLDNAIGKDKLENATLTLQTDASGIEVKGEGRWQNIPVTVEMDNDAKDRSSAAVLSFLLDDSALKRFGISLGQTLTGSLPVKIKTMREQAGVTKASIEVDLAKASIDGLIPGLLKPAGRAGKLSFDAIEKSGGYLLQNINLETGASQFKGSAEVSNNALVSARLSLFRLSPGDNVRLDYDRTATGQRIVIRGNNFDARPFLKQAPSSANTRSSPVSKGETEIDLKSTLLSGSGGEVITNAEMKVVRRGDTIRQLQMTGRLGGKKIQISGRSTTDAAAPLLIDVDDAGGFLRFIDVYSRMIGGDLDGQMTLNGSNVTGFLLARNFALRNEPALRRLVQDTPGIDRDRNLISETRFTKMRVDFNRQGTLTTIRDAVIFGPQIGLTFNGNIDNQRDRISLSGTFVPAYGLNNAFAQIPVLGNILTGSRNEGVLAVTFGISGRASQPTVSINPLSAVTPGIFRKIFEFRNDTTDTTGTGSVPPNN